MRGRNRSVLSVILMAVFLTVMSLQGCAARGGKEAGNPAFQPWEDSTLRATGNARIGSQSGWDARERLVALQEAKSDAYAKLKEKIMDVPLEPSKRVRDLLIGHPDRSGRLDDYIRTARLVSTRFIPGEGFEVETEIYLGARFKTILGMKPRSVPEAQPSAKPRSDSSFGYPLPGGP